MRSLGGEATRRYIDVDRPDGWQTTEPTFVYDPESNNYVERQPDLTHEGVSSSLGNMGLRCAS
jgi:hypothetical protein